MFDFLKKKKTDKLAIQKALESKYGPADPSKGVFSKLKPGGEDEDENAKKRRLWKEERYKLNPNYYKEYGPKE